LEVRKVMDESGSFRSAGRTKAKPGTKCFEDGLTQINSSSSSVNSDSQIISLGSNRDGPGGSGWSRSIWSSELCFVSSARIISVTATLVELSISLGFGWCGGLLLQILRKKTKKKEKNQTILSILKANKNGKKFRKKSLEKRMDFSLGKNR
jgi:hypothetical protein